MCYKHLCPEERHYIEVNIKKGASALTIADALGRAASTIIRELKRNTGKKGYRYRQAHQFAQDRHKNKPKVTKLTDSLQSRIISLLNGNWSPEQIAGRLKLEGIAVIHHETIYRWLLADKKLGGSLYKLLRYTHKRYRKRYGNTHNRSGIPHRVDIDQRPDVANKRLRIGDWEADTIIGKGHQGAILTLDERVSKLRLAWPLARKVFSSCCFGFYRASG